LIQSYQEEYENIPQV